MEIIFNRNKHWYSQCNQRSISKSTALRTRLPGQDSSFWLCPWFLHRDMTEVGVTALKWLGRCLGAVGLLCFTFSCLSCLCNYVCTFLLLLTWTCLRAGLVELGLLQALGQSGKECAPCCFGGGHGSSDHMQMDSAHTELVPRIRNKTRKIPHTPQNRSISPACLSACLELTVQGRGSFACAAGWWHLPWVQFCLGVTSHAWRESKSVRFLFAPSTSPIFPPYTWIYPAKFEI